MKINKKSWHYRFLKWNRSFYHEMPANLCGYVRSLLFKDALVLFVALSLAASLGFAIYGWVIIGAHYSEYGLKMIGQTEKYFGGCENFAIQMALIAGILLVTGALLTGFVYLTVSIPDWQERYGARKSSRTIKPQEPGLVRQWLKAKKEKVCPRIEYVDE